MPLSTEKMREYMKKRREKAKSHAEKMGQEQALEGEVLADGRPKYAGREYREDGSVVLFEQRCPEEGCKGLWSASVALPCPYCGGSGKRRYQ